MLQNVLECFKNVIKHSRRFYRVLECSRKFKNVLDGFKMFFTKCFTKFFGSYEIEKNSQIGSCTSCFQIKKKYYAIVFRNKLVECLIMVSE